MDDMVLGRLKEIVLLFDAVEFAYLFGSYATQNISKHSDVDVAIFIKEGFDHFDVGLKVHHALEIKLLKDIDVVILNDVKNYRLLKDILYEGVLIKDGEYRAMFEVKKQHEIIDYAVFKRILDVA